MTLPRALPMLLPLFLLAACGPAGKTDDAAGPPPPSASGTRQSVAVTITPYTDGPLQVRADGVGPVSSATAYDEATLKALFPRARIKSAFLHFGPGPAQPILVVEQNQIPILEISKGEEGGLGAIRLEGGDVRGPRNETLLTAWPALDLDIRHCRAGEGRDVNALVCVRPEAPNVRYLIGVPGWTHGGIPPVETLKAKGQLNGLVWRPAEGAAVGSA
ncbi:MULTISPECIES: DUF1131 domain-containing protein [unclassified Caulobacter]|uniref:DUF1131 domain-containing protein n=1 Tax=unclassified Caulobacter TaxID=2648921 RepID=UPI000D38F04F|nr:MULTISPECIES: DUF1131 domain-containing protein [unclassified Caulobacter]PTS91128.1 DUF1131 domain-containing protein [Caulobacter sp. HMWF009]PTT09871.1 DUF1131 domain-containing protein [Caulobacter sp. HMWF025]